jgi:3-mercaptopyruvate sulfurtransferase SseA
MILVASLIHLDFSLDVAAVAPRPAWAFHAAESSHVYFALRDVLGYLRVRGYHASSTEWSERVRLPVKRGTEP